MCAILAFCSSLSSPPPPPPPPPPSLLQPARSLSPSPARRRCEAGEEQPYIGSAACHFIVLGRGFFSPFSQSSLFFPSHSSLIHPAPRLSVQRFLSNTAKRGEEIRERSLSLKSPVCLFSLQYCCYLPSWLAFSSQHTFCVAPSRSALQKVLRFPSLSPSLPVFILLLHPALR